MAGNWAGGSYRGDIVVQGQQMGKKWKEGRKIKKIVFTILY